MIRLAVLVMVLVTVTLVACGGSGGTSVVGVVVDYQGDLVTVDTFTLLTADGDEFEFVPAPDGDFSFPLPHLREHLATGDPISVRYVQDGGRRVAVAVDDA